MQRTKRMERGQGPSGAEKHPDPPPKRGAGMGSDTDAHTDRQRLPVVVAHGERSEVRVDPFVCTLDAPTQVTHAVSGGEERVMDDARTPRQSSVR